MGKLGYDDTDFITGQPWRVHDSKRPAPPVVTPGAQAGDAPSDAVVLFDGSDLTEWESVKEPGNEVVPGQALSVIRLSYPAQSTSFFRSKY